METICCVCDEVAKSSYCFFHHVDEKTLHIYSGHKRCLNSVPRLIEEGKGMAFETIDKSKLMKGTD